MLPITLQVSSVDCHRAEMAFFCLFLAKGASLESPRRSAISNTSQPKLPRLSIVNKQKRSQPVCILIASVLAYFSTLRFAR